MPCDENAMATTPAKDLRRTPVPTPHLRLEDTGETYELTAE
jgi:hypothetical protein